MYGDKRSDPNVKEEYRISIFLRDSMPLHVLPKASSSLENIVFQSVLVLRSLAFLYAHIVHKF